MKKLAVIIAILALGCAGFVLLNWNASIQTSRPSVDLSPRNAYAETCFLSGEKVSGINRICYYECASGDAAITIDAADPCPMTISL
jgi:hypothetical protein